MKPTDSSTDPFEKTSVANCYQCGKCTAGCPVADQMDAVPNQILRWVQLKQTDRAARCLGIWYCVSCQTCSARCPQSVDCAGVMDVLRQQAFEQGIAPKEQQRIVAFQRAFLDNIRRNGRINEVELIMQFKTLTFLKEFSVPFLMKDSMLAPKLMWRGKFHVRGEKARDRELVRRIFDRCMKPAKTDEAPAGKEVSA